jgi:hypothetical protein
MSEINCWYLFHKEMKSWDYTTWFRIWHLHLLAEWFAFWIWLSGVSGRVSEMFSEGVKTYLMARMLLLNFFFCVHIYSLWNKHTIKRSETWSNQRPKFANFPRFDKRVLPRISTSHNQTRSKYSVGTVNGAPRSREFARDTKPRGGWSPRDDSRRRTKPFPPGEDWTPGHHSNKRTNRSKTPLWNSTVVRQLVKGDKF